LGSDWWGDTSLSQFPNFAEQIISIHLPGRRNFLYSTNATLNGDFIPAAQPTNAVILIGSWDYNPVSGNQNEQYVELRNTNSYPVDVSNWRLIGGIEFTMRPGTVIPAGKSLYLAANVNAFRARAASPHAGQGLFVQGAYGGLLSSQGNTPLILENDKGALVTKNSYAGNSSSSPFVAGNLAVLRVGDGTESLSSHGNSVFIDQFTTNGTLVGSIAIPDNATNALLISGSASSEGALTRSADGRLLEFAGYNIAFTNSTSSLPGSSSTNVPRVLGIRGRERRLCARRGDDQSIQRQQYSFRHDRWPGKLLGRGSEQRKQRNILFWRRPGQHHPNQRRKLHCHSGPRWESLFQHGQNHARHLENPRHAGGSGHIGRVSGHRRQSVCVCIQFRFHHRLCRG
jgi:hypothetical protein